MSEDPIQKPVAASFTFHQDEDCCGRTDSFGQDLTIEIEDGGGGTYAVIKTERWAAESPEELQRLLAWCLGQVKSMFDDKPTSRP
jgi:hypothetical protein